MYLLDTDHITVLEQGRGAECERLRSRMADLGERDVAVSIISFEEQTRGWLSYLTQARSLAQDASHEESNRLREGSQSYPGRLDSLSDSIILAASAE